MNTTKNSNSVNLFWTGGWDSTFRLLQLILIEKKEVQPYYIIDHERRSTGIEVYTMGLIKESILEYFTESVQYLQPTFYYNLKHIKPDANVTNAWERLNTHFHVGTQYDWLQRFRKQFEIPSVDVGLFKDVSVSESPPFRNWYNALINHEMLPESPYKKDIVNDISILFEQFNFPLMTVGKTEMFEIAKKHGWMPVMKNTRFCHRPSISIKPCGICKPCRQVVKDGMGWRVPLKGKMNRTLYKCKTTIKHNIFRL